ncbi:phosphomannomutase [Devosia lucknowensis]|uniref:Phosphomannomutase n=1 Tax=Devosia lucknowensis TaxID=1096929 RepID=A0A1Y6EYD9_9HYPH|nr:hypothetical protein [Devosia lucknowensis]SMQ66050.1 phosphomannomutase [Devosia lucknowensis]
MSSLKFGTSGLRGLVSDLEGEPARRYASAFTRTLNDGASGPVTRVCIGRDLRPSSAAIARDCAAAISGAGLIAIDCGTLPTPALALHAEASGGAAIMVTGSHIPSDRNGLKFYRPTGEIGKADETRILHHLPGGPVACGTGFTADESAAATRRYLARYSASLPRAALRGLRVGVFEHSSVSRDLLGKVLRLHGAEVVPLGRSDTFVPVDTEAFGDPVFAPMPDLVLQHRLDALVSTDGDGDRPLLMDGQGRFVRGDVLGLVTARYLGARAIATPVTSNSAIENLGWFERVIRARVGSPFVIAAMEEAGPGVVGFEANGGVLVGPGIQLRGQDLPALRTRDAMLPLLCFLDEVARRGTSVGDLVSGLGLKATASDRLTGVPGSVSASFLHRLDTDEAYAKNVFQADAPLRRAAVDGVQVWLRSGGMVHFRASGNAPELRCYAEGATEAEAARLLDLALGIATGALRNEEGPPEGGP